MVCIYQQGFEHSPISYSLSFDQLWIPVVTSACCKRSFFDESEGCTYRGHRRYLECGWELCWFGKVAVAEFPSGSTTFPATDSRLSFTEEGINSFR